MHQNALLFVCCVAFALNSIPVGAEQKPVRTNRVEALELTSPEEKDAFQFVIFGDRTGGPVEGIEVLREAVRGTNMLDPDFVMTVGDLVQGYNETPEWLVQMREFRGVMNRLKMPWYPVAGNHDVYWRGEGTPPAGHHEADYEKHFGPLWYWFTHKKSAVIVLYSDEGDPETNKKGVGSGLNLVRTAQLDWLRDTLIQTAGLENVFVFLHHPRWVGHVYADTNWDQVHELLSRAGNVRAVFAGHFHRQRYDGVRDGIAYYTLATTGGLLPLDTPSAGSGWLHHMNVVTVRQSGIEVATIPVGGVIDPKLMTPEHLADIDLAIHPKLDLLSGLIRLNADGSATGEVRYRIMNLASRALTVSLSARGSGWQSSTDRIELEPDVFRELGIHLRRRAGPAGNVLPNVFLDVAYPADHRTVRITTQRIAPVYAPRILSVDKQGEPAGYAAFDGKGGGIRIANEDTKMPEGPFTVEAWVRPDGQKKYHFIAAKGAMRRSGERGEFHLILVRGMPQFMVRLGGGLRYRVRAPRRLSIGSWHHVAGVFDGKEIRLYVSGVLEARMEASGQRYYIEAQMGRNGTSGRGISKDTV